MLKRIKVVDARVGMFVQEFCGSWMDHPFWRARFLLDNQHDLERIRGSAITELCIDTCKGLDVLGGTGQSEVAAETDALLAAVRAPEPVRPVDLDQELERAVRLCVNSKQAIVSMFSDARLGQSIEIGGARELVEEISDSVIRHPSALISLARLKTSDEYTYMHSIAVCALMIGLARQLGLPEREVREAGLAGLLHDIGKMAMPLEVLNKPGKLTDEEFDIMRSHPAAGHAMLVGNEVSAQVLDVCLHHHEKVDGSGYPNRLTSDQISLQAKMGAVCDVYDAITSERPYKRGWDPAESIRRMAEWEGHFDPAVFQAFVKSVGIYPTGSLVRLESGRLGVVMEQSDKSLLSPRVKVFLSARSKMPIPQEIVDLSKLIGRDKIVARENPADWNFPYLDELWSGLPARKGSHFD